MPDELQALCARGQERLVATDYIAAERALIEAEVLAWARQDFDALARLYMPLQEARRQIRQRAGEGAIKLDNIMDESKDSRAAEAVVDTFPHGQLLIAGVGSIAPAIKARRLARGRGLFLDVFLAAAYGQGDATLIVIVPTEDVAVPPAGEYSLDYLVRHAPPHSIIAPRSALPAGLRAGSPETYAETMQLFERLHAPFLALADATVDPLRRIAAYRQTIRVDNACELAHQRLSDTAHAVHRKKLRENRAEA